MTVVRNDDDPHQNISCPATFCNFIQSYNIWNNIYTDKNVTSTVEVFFSTPLDFDIADEFRINPAPRITAATTLVDCILLQTIYSQYDGRSIRLMINDYVLKHTRATLLSKCSTVIYYSPNWNLTTCCRQIESDRAPSAWCLRVVITRRLP